MATLPSTTQLLDHVKLHLNISSDYALAKHLGVSKSAASNWKTHTAPDDVVCLRIAELTDLCPLYVLTLVQANRQKYSVAAHRWLQIFELAKANALSQGRRVL